MKIIFKIALISILAFSSSCALIFSDKNDKVTIGSSPAGANVFINGENYGHTPTTVNIKAEDSVVFLTKKGYRSTKIDLESEVTMKNKACVADVLTIILPWSLYSVYWSGNCNEFKKKEHYVTIPRS